jgi:hypothetical protein
MEVMAFKLIQRQLGSGKLGGLHTRKRWLQCVAEHPYLRCAAAQFGTAAIDGGLPLRSWHILRVSIIKTISHLTLNLFLNF